MRKVTPEGIITTVAGIGPCGLPCNPLGDGGPATSAQLTGAAGVAVDLRGNLYIADNDLIFPRDPGFAVKANRILDLYERSWKDKPLKGDEFVISADEKTSIPARRRKHPTLPATSQRPMRVEHEYQRCGAWAYIAALDVHHARVFGRCETTTGIAPFDRLVEQVMTRPPYNDARRVFWIVDNGSSHRGKASVARLKQRFPRLTLVHGPVHASWLNQIEIYFSIVQRKVLTPNDFDNLDQLAERLLEFQYYWESAAKPFAWMFTKADLATLLAKLSVPGQIAA